MIRLAVVALVLSACGGDDEGAADFAPAVFEQVPIGADGISDPITVTIAEQTRSLTIVVSGDYDGLYALAALTTPDGVERVALPSVDVPQTMTDAYVTEQVGEMPGSLHQSIRLGIFTQIYPNHPDHPITPGDYTIRVASSKPGTTVDVTAILREDDGGRTLPVNVFAVSNTISLSDEASLGFLPTFRNLLAPADIAVEVVDIVNLPDSGLSQLTDFNEPQEPPDGMSAELALLGAANVDNDALNIFVVDSMPLGVGGWAMGTPGPPLAGTPYSGVMVAYRAGDVGLGRVVAHEVAHFIALSHVENRGISGTVYPDQLDDTEPGGNNLMEGGTELTPGQIALLQRSPLLVRDVQRNR
jgi:hypothetical protein